LAYQAWRLPGQHGSALPFIAVGQASGVPFRKWSSGPVNFQANEVNPPSRPLQQGWLSLGRRSYLSTISVILLLDSLATAWYIHSAEHHANTGSQQAR
jgi:hypothetical protein